MSLDWGRNPEYKEKMQTPPTYQGEAGMKPPTLEVEDHEEVDWSI